MMGKEVTEIIKVGYLCKMGQIVKSKLNIWNKTEAINILVV